MEITLDKRYPVEASPEQCWAVLSDIHATSACMPGAQITEQVDATHYKGTVKSKIGPAVMTFNGDIELLGLDVSSRQLQMLAKGVDRGGSSAQMRLTAHVEPGETPTSSVLVGRATVTVSGKLAQFGSRLLGPVSDAMLAQFADNFRAAASAAAEVTAERAEEAAEGGAPPAAAQAAVESMSPGVLVSGRAPAAPKPVKELNALALMWAVVKGWFAGLFGRKS